MRLEGAIRRGQRLMGFKPVLVGERVLVANVAMVKTRRDEPHVGRIQLPKHIALLLDVGVVKTPGVLEVYEISAWLVLRVEGKRDVPARTAARDAAGVEVRFAYGVEV